MAKIGILGGTFNPIHFGHLLLGETAYEQFQLDKVLVIPTKDPDYRVISSNISKEHRTHMIQMSIDDNPHFEYSDIELRRKGHTYTIDTLKELKEASPKDDFYFIMGADSLYQFHTWKNPQSILEYATILVAARDGAGYGSIESQIAYLTERFGGNIYAIHSFALEISSHNIRKRIRNHASIRYLLPANVARYIEEQGLYLNS